MTNYELYYYWEVIKIFKLHKRNKLIQYNYSLSVHTFMPIKICDFLYKKKKKGKLI